MACLEHIYYSHNYLKECPSEPCSPDLPVQIVHVLQKIHSGMTATLYARMAFHPRAGKERMFLVHWSAPIGGLGAIILITVSIFVDTIFIYYN